MTNAQTLSSEPFSTSRPQYRCPLCQLPLALTDRTYRCENNHCFDQAKEGYVNLLPVQHKHSKAPGDNKNMVDARRAFLDKGYYLPLINRIAAIYDKYGEKKAPLFDAGCGEGFYTHQHKTNTNSVYGIDIAKTAVKIAAKRYKDCFFAVGTLSQLPFEDNFFGWIYSIYAPILEQEFSRVLKADGYLLTVTPAQNHLLELKSQIYRDVKEHDTSRSPVERMALIKEERLNYVMRFDNGQDITNLLAMTPFAFKATTALLEELKNKTSFTCQADFLIRLYKNS